MFVLRSALGTQNRTYLHTRAFLDPVDPGRFDPRTNEREVMPAPSARTYQHVPTSDGVPVAAWH